MLNKPLPQINQIQATQFALQHDFQHLILHQLNQVYLIKQNTQQIQILKNTIQAHQVEYSQLKTKIELSKMELKQSLTYKKNQLNFETRRRKQETYKQKRNFLNKLNYQEVITDEPEYQEIQFVPIRDHQEELKNLRVSILKVKEENASLEELVKASQKRTYLYQTQNGDDDKYIYYQRVLKDILQDKFVQQIQQIFSEQNY